MILAGAILFAALTRAEMIERFRAPQIVQVSGLVQVRAECDALTRREYQLPIAGFASDICRRLYTAANIKERHFDSPGIVIVIGDVTTNMTNVVTRTETRKDGSKWTKILVPAPGSADRDALTAAVARGYFRAVDSLELDAAAAYARYRASVPELRIEDEYRELAEWYAGRRGKEDDEKFLKLQRSVLVPGVATRHDVEMFASRLYLYPPVFNDLFAGRFDCVSFREAIALSKLDPRIRLVAYQKIQEVALYSGGHGEKMSAAGDAYVRFLNDLVAYKKTEAELTAELDAADELLKGVLE